MLLIFCPRCETDSLISIGDGMYRCESRGYIGKANINEDVFKK